MNAADFPSLWNLGANPVLRRQAVSRLRPWRLGIWLVITQVIAAFVWIVPILIYLQVQSGGSLVIEFGSDSFRRMLDQHGKSAFLFGWFAILILQGLLVVMKGTFSVATGVAREANEGMIESQRLSPLPTAHKVLGQLLGLPLLENLLAVSLLPWALASAWLGGLSLAMMGKVYLIFATSALFHHAVGLVAGTLIRQKILAGTISQVLVILLHFVLPFFGGFGIGIISHLGMESAILYEIVSATPEMLQPKGFYPPDAIPLPVDFFRWEIAVSGYHWIITVVALAALLTMLARRWNDQESQALGKIGTTVLAAGMLVLTCGEMIPGFTRGDGLDSLMDQRTTGVMIRSSGSGSILLAGLVWSCAFALVLGLINLLLTSTLTPSPDARSRIRHRRASAWWSDGRSALPWVAFISLLSAIAWCLVVRALLDFTPAMSQVSMSAADALWIAASLVIPAVAAHALILWRGWKVALFAGFVLWLVPLMIAMVGMLLNADPNGWPKWVAGISGLVIPGYASLAEIGSPEWLDPRSVFRASLLLHAVAAGFCLLRARQGRALRPA